MFVIGNARGGASWLLVGHGHVEQRRRVRRCCRPDAISCVLSTAVSLRLCSPCAPRTLLPCCCWLSLPGRAVGVRDYITLYIFGCCRASDGHAGRARCNSNQTPIGKKIAALVSHDRPYNILPCLYTPVQCCPRTHFDPVLLCLPRRSGRISRPRAVERIWRKESLVPNSNHVRRRILLGQLLAGRL